LGCSPTVSVPKDSPVPKVTVVPVAQEETIDQDDYVGRLEASETVDVRARVSGYIQSVDFRDGDYVEEGQPLFHIEPDEYEAIQEQSVARITVFETKRDLAKSKLARLEPLAKTGAVTAEELDEARSALREAEASIISAKADANRTALDVKYTVINAPIGGRIDRTLLTRGNLVNSGISGGTALTKIVKDSPIYVYFDVDERSLLRYQKLRRSGGDEESPETLRERNLACFAQLADESDFPHAGQLDFAAARVNPTTGTVRIRGVFPNEDKRLTPGVFVRIRVPVSEPYPALLIPEKSIATDQDVKYVYVVSDQSLVVRRNLELGGTRGERRIVQAGLQPGERVIVKGLQRVRPDDKVEVVEEPAHSTK
jgi:RND family efflux transporter MFP subunit